VHFSRDNIHELNFSDKRNVSLTEYLLISDCRRPTTSSRRGLVAPGVVRGLARAYPYPRPLLPRGDAPRTKSGRPRHRRINHNSVSSIKHSLGANFSSGAAFYGEAVPKLRSCEDGEPGGGEGKGYLTR